MTAKYLDKVAAQQRAELYYEVHPRSPSAVRRPKLCGRSGTWVALLGYSLRDGIAGFGPTVEAALRAFDTQYLNSLRPAPIDRNLGNYPIAADRDLGVEREQLRAVSDALAVDTDLSLDRCYL